MEIKNTVDTSVQEVSMKANVQKQEKEAKNNSIIQVMDKMQLDPAYMPTLQEKTIIHAIEEANKRLQGADKEFEFAIHEKTKQIMVKVLNKESKEVIREIPSEKILDFVAAMCENAGLFVDEKR